VYLSLSVLIPIILTGLGHGRYKWRRRLLH
jgi:hypothetical protein